MQAGRGRRFSIRFFEGMDLRQGWSDTNASWKSLHHFSWQPYRRLVSIAIRLALWHNPMLSTTLEFEQRGFLVRTLFLNPPSYAGFDGGAGSRYQARREVRSFWYPTWLAYSAGLVPESCLLDAPPADMTIDAVVEKARGYELVIIHTSTPSLANDARVAERLKDEFSGVRIGFVGPHAMVLPAETLAPSKAIDFVVRG